MSAGRRLWISRLRRVHEKFLDASDAFPRLHHACIYSSVPQMHDVLFWWMRDRECPAIHDDLWRCSLMLSQQNGNFMGGFVDDYAKVLSIGNKKWMGRYIGSEDNEALVEFIRLSEFLSTEIHDNSEYRRFADAPWIESLYDMIPYTCEVVTIPNSRGCCLTGEVDVIGLPWNVFLTSAKAIEILVDQKSRTVRGVSAESDYTVSVRPAYERDHRWLQWNRNGLTAAKIRDHWDALSDSERKAICPMTWERVGGSTSAEKRAGYEIVKTALRKARKESAA